MKKTSHRKPVVRKANKLVLLICILISACNQNQKSLQTLKKNNMEKHIIYVSNVKKITYHIVPNSVVAQSSFNFEKTTIENNQLEMAKDDSGILVKTDGIFILYNSIDDLKSVLEMENVQSYFTGFNPYDASVIEKKDKILQIFCYKNHIDMNSLDESVASLKVLDDFISGSKVDDEFMDENFLPIIIYFGQVMVKNNGATWKIEYSNDEKIWTPMLQAKTGKIVDIGIYLYEEFENFKESKFPNLLQSTYVMNQNKLSE